MNRTRLILLIILIAALLGGALGWRAYKRRHAHIYYPWIPKSELGHYTGPLTRPIAPYKPESYTSRRWLDPSRTAPTLTTYHTFAASALAGRQSYCLVYLPPGYHDPANAARRYPVLYWLHGSGCEPQHGAPFVDALDAAIRAGRAPHMIAVLPNGLSDGWYVDAADGTQPVESILIHDLLPHIDATFRTIPDRRARAIEGFSMGAWGAAHFAFKYPDRFCAVGLASPAISSEGFQYIQGLFGGSMDAYHTEEPTTLAHRHADKLKTMLRVRVLAGEKDWTLHPAKTFAGRLQQWGLPATLTILPGVDHDTAQIYQSAGPGAFEFYHPLSTP